jgi:hypothetical protein
VNPVAAPVRAAAARLRCCLPAVALAAAGALMPGRGHAAGTDDRLAVSLQGSTLTQTNGGGGGSVAWLHNFDADTLAGIAAEHQSISSAHWTFGSVNGAVTLGTGDARYSLYGDAHEGDGNNGPHRLNYEIEAAGVIGTYFHRLSAELEDKRIDVDTLHGNLPKAQLAYLWNPHLLTTVSYAYSVTGNLGTRLSTVRIDSYGPGVSFLAGGSYGPVSPIVIGVVGVLGQAGFERYTVGIHRLKEGYGGVSKALPRLRGELTLIADYQDLAGSKRTTLTLNFVFHVGHTGSAR